MKAFNKNGGWNAASLLALTGRITKGIRGGLSSLHSVKLPYRATSDTLVPLYKIPNPAKTEKYKMNT